MSNAWLLVPLGVVGLAALVRWVFFRPAARLLRAVRKLRRADIAQALDGEPVVIAGTLGFAGEPLVAPLSGRPCAGWDVWLEERRPKRGWKTVLRESRAQSFYLRDESGGKALVALDQDMHERVVLTADRGFGWQDLGAADPRVEKFLADRGISPDGLLFARRLRYREGALEEGEPVVAAGHGRWEVDPEPDRGAASGSYRDAPRRLVLESTSRLPVQVSDDATVRRRLFDLRT